MEFRQARLSNGMQVIGEIRPTAPSAAIGFFVQTGARDETPEVSGVSHFLEHMMFKGTAKRSALDVTYDLAKIGAQANAFTSEENTVYYMQILPEFISDGVELLSDMLRPALDETEFSTEKNVILEEIALYQDRPTHVLFEQSLRQHFAGHPAGNSVLGSTESVRALSASQMRTYFQNRYTAANIVFAVTGNANWDAVLELLDKHCGGWESHAVGRDRRPHVPTASTTTLRRDGLQMAHGCLIADGPSEQSEYRYAAGVLSCILGDSSGSKAYWDLVDKGLADAAHIDFEDMDHTGFVYGYVSAEPEKIEQVRDRLEAIMCEPLKFTDEDLVRALTKLRTRLVLQGESTMRRLMAVGLEWIARGRYRTLEEELARLKQVDRSEIQSLLSGISLRPITKVTLLPQ
ncbi:MAG: insulinase family protein [Deltaproteobacteria bacterium]|nr:insulinase family protein [Deltaproteobacteria bacterium]